MGMTVHVEGEGEGRVTAHSVAGAVSYATSVQRSKPTPNQVRKGAGVEHDAQPDQIGLT